MLEDLTESIHGSTVVARTQLPRHSVSATLHCCTACTYRTLTAAALLLAPVCTVTALQNEPTVAKSTLN